MLDPVSFPVFLVMWNRRQNCATPALHLRIARWLETHDREDSRMLLLAFRGAGKSTLVGLFCAWTLYRDPDTRILVLAADDTLAARMVRAVRRILERHPLTPALKPPHADQWAADRFTVARTQELRDPSMRAAGIGANVTGSRADLIVCDDVEVPNTCDGPEKRENLRARLSETDYILAPGGRVVTIGTPHVAQSIYIDPQAAACARLEIPVLTPEGSSAWPEKFPLERIESLRLRSGPNRFASQMMLRPLSPEDSRLPAHLFQPYDAQPMWNKEIGGLYLDGRRLVHAGAWWDPAFAAARGDRSVLACVFVDEDGHYRVQQLAYLRTDPATDDDEATAQCRAVAQIAKSLFLPLVAVETNGLGKFLPAILRREMGRIRAGCAVVEKTSHTAKDTRILEALDAPLAARRIHVHRSVLETPFADEIRDWRPGRSRGHDDGLDALAGALSLQPTRVDRIYGGRRPDWMGGERSERPNRGFQGS